MRNLVNILPPQRQKREWENISPPPLKRLTGFQVGASKKMWLQGEEREIPVGLKARGSS